MFTCDNFNRGRCRSCPRLALPAAQQFAGKFAAFETTARQQLGATVEIAPLWIPASIFPSRTKAKMSVTGTVEAPCIGILDNLLQGQELLDCPLHVPLINRTLTEIATLIPEFKLFPYDIGKRTGELKSLILKASRDESSLMVRFVLRSTEAVTRVGKAAKRLMAAIPQICSVSVNIQPIAHAILEGDSEILLAGSGILWERYGSISLAFGPQSFSQVTPETAAAVYSYATDLIVASKPESLLDLFCGVGGFSLHAAQHVPRVTGVEIAAEAIECARLGAKQNGVDHIQFIAAPTDGFLAEGCLNASFLNPEVVICNPPRRGLSAATIEQLERLSPKRIVYSSCNPDSLFRDLAAFGSYQTTSVAPFEMFPLTEHLEVVACLDRR